MHIIESKLFFNVIFLIISELYDAPADNSFII